MKRIVTYDIKKDGDYSKFYTLKDKYKAKQLTESTYEFDMNVDIKKFYDELCEAFSSKDNAYLIYNSDSKGLTSHKI